MKVRQITYHLHLPRSIRMEVERLVKAEGISMNQFVATAVAEKLAAWRTADFFAECRKNADFTAFDRLMHRECDQAPPSEDMIAPRE